MISATPALRERELAKEASLIQALTAALERRGVGATQAVLAAQVGMAAFGQAVLAWFDDPSLDLDDLLLQAVDDVRAVVR